MTTLTINDVLATSYLDAQSPPLITKDNTALLLIDIQHMATPEYLASKAMSAGLAPSEVDIALADYTTRFEAALHQCQHMLEAARACSIPPIHVKIQSASGDARDTGPLHRRMGWQFPPHHKASAFLKEATPLENEIVITKTASGAFTGTSLDTILRNMGIQHLFMCGFMTDECVETTARVALDLGYVAKIVSDATTTYHEISYQNVMDKFGAFGFTLGTDEAKLVFKSIDTKTKPVW